MTINQLPVPMIVTTKEIVDKVMAGEIISIPVVQFSQFLFEADMDMLECKINCAQIGSIVELTRWT